MPKKKTATTKQKKSPRIKPINNFALLMVLSVFQLLSGTAAAGGTGTFEVKVFAVHAGADRAGVAVCERVLLCHAPAEF